MRKTIRRIAIGTIGLLAVAMPATIAASGKAGAATRSSQLTVAAVKWPAVKPGARGERVWAIQYLLRARGFKTGADGIFGPVTTKDVRTFQKRVGLTPDGIVGVRTWLRLIVVVKFGSRGEAVRAVQHNLHFGYRYKLDFDGIFGPLTRDAVKDFQGRFKLGKDGVVGTATWLNILAHES